MTDTNGLLRAPTNFWTTNIIGDSITVIPTNAGGGWKVILKASAGSGDAGGTNARQQGALSLTNLSGNPNVATQILAGANVTVTSNNAGIYTITATSGGGGATTNANQFGAAGSTLTLKAGAFQTNANLIGAGTNTGTFYAPTFIASAANPTIGFSGSTFGSQSGDFNMFAGGARLWIGAGSDGTFYPTTDGDYNLGASSQQWGDLYAYRGIVKTNTGEMLEIYGTAAVNNAVITNTLTLSAQDGNKILRTDASKNVAVVTVGSGLSFDGTTLTASGGSGITTNASQFGATTNGQITIKSGAAMTNLVFDGFSVGRHGIYFSVSNNSLASLPFYIDQGNDNVFMNGTLTVTAIDTAEVPNITTANAIVAENGAATFRTTKTLSGASGIQVHHTDTSIVVSNDWQATNLTVRSTAGGPSLALLVETNVLVVTNSRVGIKTTAPAALLDIAGTVGATGTPLFHSGTNIDNGITVQTNGRVGIGTNGPQATMHIIQQVAGAAAAIRVDDTNGAQRMVIGAYPDEGNYGSIYFGTGTPAGSTVSIYGDGSSLILNAPASSGDILFRAANGAKMAMKGTSTLMGIGDVSPQSALHVSNVVAQFDVLRVYTQTGNGSLFAFGVSSNRLALFGATGATNTPPAGYAGMFAETNTGVIELAVIDSAGNVTQISPHPRDCPPAFLITTNWLSGWPEIGKSVKLFNGTVTWKNTSLSSLVQRWQIESVVMASNYMLLMPAQLRALLPSALISEESFSEYNTRLGLTPGNGGLVENNWDAVQTGRQNDYDLGRTNELIAFNTPLVFTNDLDEVISLQFNTNIFVRPIKDVKEPKPALIEYLSPEIKNKKPK